ncbi:hypothetical protein GCM10011515_10890 [Tsuneonella deserti]|uniref:histidine kinase n=1 Tax=Tsuneonella deserti TaxID=2035528 RepID=A0ABQ1S4N7_9SPHN|nr:HAMP domain-containing sensor histidine kinase [Tsuneonella deserti]GGD92974.1 hypothetical protein GCM10011515_10890 [Tsuneonella deserti]
MSASNVFARGVTDGEDRLIEADEPLAGLQTRCGGDLPGTVAIPQLLEAVRKSRTLGLKIARTIIAFDGEAMVRAWVDIAPPQQSHGGCTIEVGAWTATPPTAETDDAAAARRIEIDRDVAELTARLDGSQRLLTVDAHAADLDQVAHAMRAGQGKLWSEFVTFPDLAHRQPLHWRLLDGARCEIPGSGRRWTVTLVPLGRPEPGSAGFELLFVADTPLSEQAPLLEEPLAIPPAFAQEVTPVLRQPIARIIANAETIRARLAGPLADEYSDYAADIASAGQHLLSLIDDLADLEAVESADFSTQPDLIDLADVARRATGILAVRARAKDIQLLAPGESEAAPATGEFRRVLQILLNLVGNAIAYSPAGSRVTLSVDKAEEVSRVTVADEGPGMSAEQGGRVFNQFERLGRSGDGGSGLGLYISRKLARAMGGDLVVESAPGEGARFILTLPG